MYYLLFVLRKKTTILFIGIVILLALFLRVFTISTNPPGFFCDEAAIGYNTYKILTTGKDEYGVSFPVFFQSFGDYRLPVPIYANLLTIPLFGLSEISVRMTTIIFGVTGIIFIILVAKEIFGTKVAIISGSLLAISPWHIQMSRWGSEYIYFITLFSISFYFFLLSLKKSWYLPLSSFFFGLTLYTYYPSLFVTPLFLLPTFLLFIISSKHKDRWKVFTISICVFFILCLPVIDGFKNGTLLTRWHSVNTESSLPQRVQQFFNSYSAHFSLPFLFTQGDAGMKNHLIMRHSVRGIGELYLFQLPFLLLGIVSVLFRKRTPGTILLLWLILLFPLGSAIINDGPLATRSIIGILPLTIFSAYGIAIFYKIIKKHIRHLTNRLIILGGILTIICISFLNYLFLFYISYPLYSSDFWGWQYGPQKIISYFVEHEKEYDELYMIGEFNAPEIFFKFYAPHNCQKCKIGTPDKNYKKNKKQLFAVTPNYILSHQNIHMHIQKTIYYPNRDIAFEIGEIVQ